MTVSVVVPAYNEAGVIGRLLDALDDPSQRLELDVVVVCNGCVDGTEDVAGCHPLGPRVVTLDTGSKHAALLAGDAHSTAFPRFYVDADVVITARDIITLAAALETGPLAVAPERDVRLDRSVWAVRAYYRVWLRLGAVRLGLWGRGVLGVNAEGFSRLASRPDVMGDDLYAHQQFAPSERLVVAGTTATIQGPRTTLDLLRRRVRAARGNAQAATNTSPGRSGLGQLASLVRHDPALAPSAATFALVTAAARVVAATRPGSRIWLRDESSRAADPSLL